jgi:hypothetical protein
LAELEIPQLDPTRAFSYSPALFDAYAEVLEELGREDDASVWRDRAVAAAEALDESFDVGGDETVEIIEVDDPTEYAAEDALDAHDLDGDDLDGDDLDAGDLDGDDLDEDDFDGDDPDDEDVVTDETVVAATEPQTAEAEPAEPEPETGEDEDEDDATTAPAAGDQDEQSEGDADVPTEK